MTNMKKRGGIFRFLLGSISIPAPFHGPCALRLPPLGRLHAPREERHWRSFKRDAAGENWRRIRAGACSSFRLLADFVSPSGLVAMGRLATRRASGWLCQYRKGRPGGPKAVCLLPDRRRAKKGKKECCRKSEKKEEGRTSCVAGERCEDRSRAKGGKIGGVRVNKLLQNTCSSTLGNEWIFSSAVSSLLLWWNPRLEAFFEYDSLEKLVQIRLEHLSANLQVKVFWLS